MPKAAPYTLIWSQQRNVYELWYRKDSGQENQLLVQADGETWFAWLASHSSFSFRGKHGRLTLLKESRARGDGYWYAYRRHDQQVAKKYLGRTSSLSIACLEEAAKALNADTCPTMHPISHRSDLASKTGGLANRPHNSSSAEITVTTVTSSPSVPLLAPKLCLPRLRSSLLPRDQLCTRLDAGLDRKLTLISAPAGFGKTTLASTWATRHHLEFDGPVIAWFSLDAGDNDPVRFWRYIFTASQTFHPTIGASSLALLQQTRQRIFETPSFEAILTEFLNELSRLTSKGVLILEDYHVITSPQIHEMLTTFIEHLPPMLHLMILTRTEPPLHLARLRARDELVELRPTDMLFSPEESRAFLELISPLPLSADAINHLAARTEGWAVGLQLAALALRGRQDAQEVAHFLTTFTGGQRHILDYLVSDVLSSQPESLQLFLLQTSVLSSLTASLCEAVTDRSDSALTLTQLERANLFLVPLDAAGQWYRYHALFAEAMRQEARLRFGETSLRKLYAKASSWYEQHGLFAEAIEAALSACEFIRAADLIERIVQPGQSSVISLFRTMATVKQKSIRQMVNEAGELHTLCRWLEQLPEQVLQDRPVLCFLYAVALLFTLERHAPATLARIEQPFQIAERHWQAEGNRQLLGEILAFRSLAFLWHGALSQSFRTARQALAWLPEDEIELRGISLLNVGMEELLAGQMRAARRTFSQARSLCEAAGSTHPLLAAKSVLGEICFMQGELRQSMQLYRQVLTEALDKKNMLDDRGNGLFGLARLSYEWNDLETAELQASQALAIGKQLPEGSLQVNASLLMARIFQARSQIDRAQQVLQVIAPQVKNPRLSRALLLEQARLALANGDLIAVQRWEANLAPQETPIARLQEEQEALLIARLRMMQGEFAAAINLLEDRWIKAHEAGRLRSELEILLLSSLAHFKQNDIPRAKRLLLQALEVAQSDGHQRLFLDEGADVQPLLRALLPDVRDESIGDYVRALLGAFASDRPSHVAASFRLIEPLSQQEQRVLRLLVNGLSNPEIAQELVVSINTVKTQVQSIYRKLNVASRKEARETARRLNLLS